MGEVEWNGVGRTGCGEVRWGGGGGGGKGGCHTFCRSSEVRRRIVTLSSSSASHS